MCFRPTVRDSRLPSGHKEVTGDLLQQVFANLLVVVA